jgi:hypothetical protein
MRLDKYEFVITKSSPLAPKSSSATAKTDPTLRIELSGYQIESYYCRIEPHSI